MNKTVIIALSFMVLGVPLIAWGQSQTSTQSPSQDVYPKVGLVLSGGGARGFAHIGAIKVLEELGMPIDYIVGTSMGSIVGGLYASGYSAQELAQIIEEVNWEDIFSDTPPRNLWSYQKKREASKYIFGVDFDLKKGFVIPQGLTSGQKISNLMAFLTLPVADIEDFDDFPIPYRAVAADIVTGEEVVLDHGSLPEAMRASMAVPGAFTPVRIENHLLVDGGIVNNLPVDVAKRMGADVIIAVDISSPLKGQEELGNPISILSQMIGLQMLKITSAQQKMADVLIVPDLRNYFSVSFGSSQQISALGEEYTRLKIDELQALLDHIRKTRPASRSVPPSAIQTLENLFIEDIEIEGNTRYNESILLKQLHEQVGDTLMPDLLEERITELFSTGDYETVKFTLAPGKEKGKILKLRLEERRKNLHQLRFGMNYESRFDDAESDKMIFLVNSTFNQLTGTGSYWSSDLQFVNVTKFDSEYFQALGKGFFVAPYLYDHDDYQIIYENEESVARYDRTERGIGFRLGTFIYRIGEVSVGFLLEDLDVSPSTAVDPRFFQDYNETLTSLTFRSHVDHLDTFPFPHSGTFLNVDYQLALEDLGGDTHFHRLLLDYRKYFALNARNTLGFRLQAGTDFDSNIREYKYFVLGGNDSFAGYKVEELRGAHLGAVNLEYRYRLNELPSAVGGGIFLVATGSIGNTWKTLDEIEDDFSLEYGSSLGIGVDTILGPVRADFAIGKSGRRIIYLNIGYKF